MQAPLALRQVPFGLFATVAAWAIHAYPDATYRTAVFKVWNAAVARAIQSHGHVESMEFQVHCRDTTQRDIVFSAVVLDDSLLITLVDITERNARDRVAAYLQKGVRLGVAKDFDIGVSALGARDVSRGHFALASRLRYDPATRGLHLDNPEILSVDVPGSGSLTTKLEAARGEMRDIDSNLLAAQSALASINGQLSGTPQTIALPGVQGGAKGALAQAQADLGAMRARGLTDSHPDVISLRAQIASLQKAAAGEGGGGGAPNPAYTSLISIKADREASLVALQSRKASLQAEIARLSAQQYGEPAIAAEAARISRDYDVLKQQYDKLLQDREQLRTRGKVEDKASQFRFDIIQQPGVPQKPAAPNRPLLLFGVLIVGLGAGVAAAYALGQLKSSFATPQKLERAFDLPVIGSISLTISDAARVTEKRRLKQFAGACAGLGTMFVILVAIEIVSIGTIA